MERDRSYGRRLLPIADNGTSRLSNTAYQSRAVGGSPAGTLPSIILHGGLALVWAFLIGLVGAVLTVPLTLPTKALLLDVDPNTRLMSSLSPAASPRRRTRPRTPP
jgi:hypothetical protein